MRAMLCHMCGKKADKTCRMCGRPVCDDDYDSKTGTCSACKSGRRIVKSAA
jgi:hypothetical protein